MKTFLLLVALLSGSLGGAAVRAQPTTARAAFASDEAAARHRAAFAAAVLGVAVAIIGEWIGVKKVGPVSGRPRCRWLD